MEAAFFLEQIQTMGVAFYTGVPDSQLKALTDLLCKEYELGERHVIAANEGAAVGLAAGHYLACGRPALVYLQNSGLGNIVNPVTSLLHKKVYGIPAVFVIGWRGEPGIQDEPQHVFQGQITLGLLSLLQIEAFILSEETTQEELVEYVKTASNKAAQGESVAFVIKKGALTSGSKVEYQNRHNLRREKAIQIIVENTGAKDILVSTTGKISRELYEIRRRLGQGHDRDFLTVGSMGHASMIALGIAMEKKERRVWCIDGDGAALMHMGSMAVLAGTGCGNLTHILLNNNAYESVGGMSVDYGKANFSRIAGAVGYTQCQRAETQEELRKALILAKETCGIKMLEVMVSLKSRKDLGRPEAAPDENKKKFMNFIKTGNAEEG